MDNPTPRPLLDRNPITNERHRNEVFWQITFPLVIGSFIFVGLAVLGIWTGNAQVRSQEADASLIWMMTSVIVASFLFLIILSIFTYGVIRLIGILPQYSKRGLDVILQIQLRVCQMDDRLVEPILIFHEFVGSLRALKSNLTRSKFK